jgi:hypothetical protein
MNLNPLPSGCVALASASVAWQLRARIGVYSVGGGESTAYTTCTPVDAKVKYKREQYRPKNHYPSNYLTPLPAATPSHFQTLRCTLRSVSITPSLSVWPSQLLLLLPLMHRPSPSTHHLSLEIRLALPISSLHQHWIYQRLKRPRS